MKFNVANPATGQQKCIEIEDEHKYKHIFEKRISHEVPLDNFGEDYKGYIVRLTGGEDKQGFSMKQGVLTDQRVRLLLKAGATCYRAGRKGERKRKSVRGCIYNHDMSAVSMVIVRQGPKALEGLTDTKIQACNKTLGPKRASKIKKLFNLEKEDEVTKFVIRKELKASEKHSKPRSKAPKIQRLITSVRVQRKRAQKAAAVQRAHNAKESDAAYRKLMAQRSKLLRAKKDSERSRRISQASSN